MASSDACKKEAGPASIFYEHPFKDELIATAKAIATRGKGILAADEFNFSLAKKFEPIGLECTSENARRYRQLLFTTPGLGEYISGVILFDETIRQKSDDGTAMAKVLQKQGIIPGIKVDEFFFPLPSSKSDFYTQGLTDLDKRAAEYYSMGARFAKWRAVLKIVDGYVSETAIHENAWTLARYAAICQANGLVPIVEPDLVMDGHHSLKVQQYWTQKVWSACYKALVDQEVLLEGSLFKPAMCLPGADFKGARSIKENALATVTAMKRTIPVAMPGIVFLSGGMSEEEATEMLNAINQFSLPWSASFSFGRALQRSVLATWKGDDANLKKAQDMLLLRAKANGAAQLGKYDGFAATEESKKSLQIKGYVY